MDAAATPISPRPATADAAVELVSLTKRYAGGAPAVDAINLRIRSGSYCCLLGPSGCGKSTTLRMIAGHESVTTGDILLEGRNITHLPAAARGTAMMFQSFALFPHLSALDNVAFSLKMKGVGKTERHMKAGELLERDWSQPHRRHEALMPVFKRIYENTEEFWEEYHLCEQLVDVESNFQFWRFRHMKTVERIIGYRRGTGGSSGVAFLRQALDLTFFPELFDVRTALEAPVR